MLNSIFKNNDRKDPRSDQRKTRLDSGSQQRRYNSSLDRRRPLSHYASSSDLGANKGGRSEPKKIIKNKDGFWGAVRPSYGFKKKIFNGRGYSVFNRLISGVILFSILGVFVYSLSLSPSGSVIQMSSNSFRYRDPRLYSDFTDNYIKSNILSRNKLTFNTGDFEKDFKEEFAEARSVAVFIPLGGRGVKIKVSTPKPLVELDGVSVRSGERAFVDRNGNLSFVGDAGDINDVPTLKITDGVQSLSGGTKVLTDQEIEVLHLLDTEITPDQISGLPEDFGVVSAEMSVANGRLEVHFLEVDYKAVFSTYFDPREQVGSLKAILKRLYSDDSESIPSKYIDVRVHEKVFVN